VEVRDGQRLFSGDVGGDGSGIHAYTTTIAAGVIEEIVFSEVKSLLLVTTILSSASKPNRLQIATDFDGTGATYASDIALQAKTTNCLLMNCSVKKVSLRNSHGTDNITVNVFAL